MTQATARALLRAVARNAGSSDEYTDIVCDQSVQMAGDDFEHFTQATEQTSDLAITGGSSAVTLAAVVGFETPRIERAWIPAVGPLTIIDHSELLQRQVNTPQTGVPLFLAFSTKTGVGDVYPTPVLSYTAKSYWHPPFGQNNAGVFAPLSWGAAGAGVTLNIGDADLMQVINFGATAFLQHNEKKQAYASESWAKYVEYRSRRTNAGTLGIQRVKLLSLRDLRACPTGD